jgi:hypothetical protein
MASLKCIADMPREGTSRVPKSAIRIRSQELPMARWGRAPFSIHAIVPLPAAETRWSTLRSSESWGRFIENGADRSKRMESISGSAANSRSRSQSAGKLRVGPPPPRSRLIGSKPPAVG